MADTQTQTLRIVTHGSLSVHGWEIWLAGQNITHLVRGIDLHAHADSDPPVAIVHLDILAQVELPDVLQAVVSATAEEVAPDPWPDAETELLLGSFPAGQGG